uniref:Uncharacterized protein n=1 Tax=Arundo donax TaxID=35708 RepID=A0A0A9BB04_ARUDO
MCCDVKIPLFSTVSSESKSLVIFWLNCG